MKVNVGETVFFNKLKDATPFKVVAKQETNIHVAELKSDGSKYSPQWADESMVVRKL